MVTTSNPTWRTRWHAVRRIWVTLGLAATVVFVLWSLVALRATSEARDALQSDARVRVTAAETHWTFQPASDASNAGLLFFAGALVDPVAYAPIMRRVAEAGFPAVLVRLPRRGAFGGANGPDVLVRGVNATTLMPEVTRWVLAGHSRGGEIATRLARTNAGAFRALVLIGTTHPRDFSLANTPLDVTRIYGTRDTVADVEKIEATRVNLPAATREVRIDGGNHSQFGYYGFQPGDWPATITRIEQQQLTVAAVLDALRRAAH